VHHADFNIFDTSFTTTIVFKITAVPATDQLLLQHSSSANDGFGCYITATTGLVRTSVKGAAGIYTTIDTAAVSTGQWHVFQYVRNGNNAKAILDGTHSSVADVTSKGVDASTTFYVGGLVGTDYLGGAIQYLRLDAEALSEERLAYEKDYLLGLAARSGTASIGWDYSRASTAYATYSGGSMSLVAAGIPRVSGDGGGVLVEGSGTNLLTYTNNFSTNWTKTRSSISATAVVLPDGTTGTANTLHEDGTAANNHMLYRTVVIASGTSYCHSQYFKYNPSAATPREWIQFYDDNGIDDLKGVFFNIRYGYVGTVAGGLTGGYGIVPIGNGWFRAWVWATQNKTGNASASILIGEADNDTTFSGQDQDSVFIFGPQYEVGSFPTSYTPNATTSTVNGRASDSLLITPYKLSKDLRVPGVTEKAYFDFETQDPLAATITSTDGGYVFTKAGTVTALNDYTKMRRFVFNGTDSRYTLTDAGGAWSPAGSFSVVAVVTPAAVPVPASGDYMYIFDKWTTTGDQRAWAFYYNDTPSWTFGVSQTGAYPGNTTFLSHSSAVEVGRTQLLVGTYTHTGVNNGGTCTFYLDDRTPAATAANACYGPAKTGGTASVNIGRGSATSWFNGQIHYLAFIDGTAISDVQYAAIYKKFKQANVLPLGFGTDAVDPDFVATKLTIEFEAKCAFSSVTDIGSATGRDIFEISGNYGGGLSAGYGGADSNNNRIKITPSANNAGKVRFSLFTNESTTDRYFESSVITTYNQWHKYKVYYDFSNLANSTAAIDGTALVTSSGMTGTTREFDTRDTMIRVGKDYAGTTNGYCSYRNLRIVPDRF
jgi:hypothetical protein